MGRIVRKFGYLENLFKFNLRIEEIFQVDIAKYCAFMENYFLDEMEEEQSLIQSNGDL